MRALSGNLLVEFGAPCVHQYFFPFIQRTITYSIVGRIAKEIHVSRCGVVCFGMRRYHIEQVALNGLDALTAVKSGRFADSLRERPLPSSNRANTPVIEAVPGALSGWSATRTKLRLIPQPSATSQWAGSGVRGSCRKER